MISIDKKALISICLIFLGFFLIGKYFYDKHERNLAAWITVYGNVDIREVNLSFRIPGLVKIMSLEEGYEVKQGQIIAYLDKDQYIDQLNQAQAVVSANNAELNKLLAGTRPEEVAQAKALVQEQEAITTNAKILFERNKQGYLAGVVSKQEFDNSKKQIDASRAKLSSTKNALLEALNGPRKEDIQNARANLQAAIAQASHLERTISYTDLISPSDGTILTRIKEPGAYVSAGEPIYTLAINSPKWIQTYIEEKNLGKIKPGMEALINNDSYPNKTYKGIVGFISPTAEFTPKSVETSEVRSSLVYRVRIIVYDTKNQLRQGMPVTVKFKI